MNVKLTYLSELMSWLKSKIEIQLEKRFDWLAIFITLLLFGFGNLTIESAALWLIVWLFFAKLNNKLIAYNNELKELNEKFAVNQRKLTKSIREHNDFVSESMTEQKRFFQSIVNPKKENN
jgi:hypothetical protein